MHFFFFSIGNLFCKEYILDRPDVIIRMTGAVEGNVHDFMLKALCRVLIDTYINVIPIFYR